MATKADYATLTWAGGTHRFSLTPCNQHRAVVMATESQILALGPLYRRLMGSTWSAFDVRQTIRCGLLARWPGLTPKAVREVEALLSEHVDGKPVADSLVLAQTIVAVAMFGVDADAADTPTAPEGLNAESAA